MHSSFSLIKKKKLNLYYKAENIWIQPLTMPSLFISKFPNHRKLGIISSDYIFCFFLMKEWPQELTNMQIL